MQFECSPELNDDGQSMLDWDAKVTALLSEKGPLYSNQIAVHFRKTQTLTDVLMSHAIRCEVLFELPDGRICTCPQYIEHQQNADKPTKAGPIRFANSNTGQDFLGVPMGTPRDLSLGCADSLRTRR